MIRYFYHKIEIIYKFVSPDQPPFNQPHCLPSSFSIQTHSTFLQGHIKHCTVLRLLTLVEWRLQRAHWNTNLKHSNNIASMIGHRHKSRSAVLKIQCNLKRSQRYQTATAPHWGHCIQVKIMASWDVTWYGLVCTSPSSW